MNKFLIELLAHLKDLGINVGKLSGTRSNITPITKPFITRKTLDPMRVKDVIDKGGLTNADLIAQGEEVGRLALSGQLNDIEMHMANTNLKRIKPVVKPESAEILDLSSGQRVTPEGIETLKESVGQTAAPGTTLGNVESRVNQIKALGKELEKQTGEKVSVGDILKEYGEGQRGYAAIQRQGLVRATSREIMERDLAAGKLKGITKDDLATKDPIELWRTHYGEDALEQLDSLSPQFGKLTSEKQAADLAKTKYKFEPRSSPIKESYTEEEFQDILNKGPLEPETKAKGGSIGIDYLLGI
jgi:hypothetical protein